MINVLAFSILTIVTHVHVLPTIDQNLNVGCCVVAAEIPPSTSISLKVSKNAQNFKANLSVKWKF